MSLESVVDTSLWPCATVGASWALSETLDDVFDMREQGDRRVVYSLDVEEFPQGRYLKKFRGLRDIRIDFPRAKCAELYLNNTLIERQESEERSSRITFTSFRDSFILPLFLTDSLEIHVWLHDDAFLPRSIGSFEGLLFEYKNKKPFCISSPSAQSIITYDGTSEGLNIVVNKSLLASSRKQKLSDQFKWNLSADDETDDRDEYKDYEEVRRQINNED